MTKRLIRMKSLRPIHLMDLPFTTSVSLEGKLQAPIVGCAWFASWRPVDDEARSDPLRQGYRVDVARREGFLFSMLQVIIAGGERRV